MPKPTLLQTIFNRPSQSYTLPPSISPRRPLVERKNFHSVKNELLRIASENDLPEAPMASPEESITYSPNDNDDEATDDDDMFYTPDTSPRQSTYSDHDQVHTAHITTNPADALTDGHSLRDVTTYFDPRSANPSSYPPLSFASASSSSLASTLASSSTNIASSSTHTQHTWRSSLSESSTRATTPSDFDQDNVLVKRSGDTHLTVPPVRSTSRSPSRAATRRRKRESRTPTDDWAKDVRWLVPTKDLKRSTATLSTPSRQSRRTRPVLRTDSQMVNSTSLPGIPVIEPNFPRRSKSVTSQSSTATHRTVGRRRMSAVWEEDENTDDNVTLANHTRRSQSEASSYPGPARSRTISAPHNSQRNRPLSQFSGGSRVTSSTSYSDSSHTVNLPISLSVSDGGSPSGFTSLVLPRAAYNSTNPKRFSAIFGNGSSVDMTRSGLAQTTMSTISITKNAASANMRPRILSLPSLSSETSVRLSSKRSKSAPKHSMSNITPPLSITSFIKPPTRVNSHQVLVQVYAVAVDNLDDVIVCERAVRNDCYGFIPGRSFVGRTVECGYEVSAISKSDWVIGLLDVRKCGGLAEFIVVEKSRLIRCPKPIPTLDISQLALLPLCGIPAHRALRSSDLIHRGSRALILQGQDGAGAFALQELVALGADVTVQIPPPNPEDEGSEDSWKTEERIRNWGASEVVVESPVVAIKSLPENGFDLVIDTVGGRSIWDACRRVLRATGQFTTLVGDSVEAVPTVNARFRSNFRSLQRAFVKKDRKSIGYAWISPIMDLDNDGADIRDTLVPITQLAIDGILVPWVSPSRTVTFERAPSLFATGGKNILAEGRTGVVRVIS